MSVCEWLKFCVNLEWCGPKRLLERGERWVTWSCRSQSNAVAVCVYSECSLWCLCLTAGYWVLRTSTSVVCVCRRGGQNFIEENLMRHVWYIHDSIPWHLGRSRGFWWWSYRKTCSASRLARKIRRSHYLNQVQHNFGMANIFAAQPWWKHPPYSNWWQADCCVGERN